jgi:hypothetical protein
LRLKTKAWNGFFYEIWWSLFFFFAMNIVKISSFISEQMLLYAQVRVETFSIHSTEKYKGHIGKYILLIIEVLSSLRFNISVFGGVKLCGLVDSYNRFGRKLLQDSPKRSYQSLELHCKAPQKSANWTSSLYETHVHIHVQAGFTRRNIERYFLNRSRSSISGSGKKIPPPMVAVRLSALRPAHPLPPERFLVLISLRG